MAAKDLVLAFLRKEGFCPEEEEFGILFKYQMASFIFFNNSNDEEFFQLVMPGIFDIDEENISIAMLACNRLNSDVKVAKAFVSQNNDVWLAFEILLDENPEVESIVPRALNTLMHARDQFYAAIKELSAE